MAEINIILYSPLFYEMTEKRVGPFIINAKIEDGETLGNLLLRLYRENQEGWHNLYNPQTRRMRPPIRTLLNGKGISPSNLEETPLKGGDQVRFLLIYGGG